MAKYITAVLFLTVFCTSNAFSESASKDITSMMAESSKRLEAISKMRSTSPALYQLQQQKELDARRQMIREWAAEDPDALRLYYFKRKQQMVNRIHAMSSADPAVQARIMNRHFNQERDRLESIRAENPLLYRKMELIHKKQRMEYMKRYQPDAFDEYLVRRQELIDKKKALRKKEAGIDVNEPLPHWDDSILKQIMADKA